MKKLIAILLSAAVLAGCTSVTSHGPCIGIGDEDKDPSKVYKVNIGNLIVGIIFIETIVVPIVVAVDQFQCPVADRKKVEQ